MDNDKILIDICEMVYQRSATNKANVAPSAVKKDTPKLKKPRRMSFKQHFQETTSGRDFLDVLGGEKEQLIDKCIMHIRFYFSTSSARYRNGLLRYVKILLSMYKSPTYRGLIDLKLAHNKEYPLTIRDLENLMAGNRRSPWIS